MDPLTTITGRAVPLRAENVDTDQLIPARFLTTTSREGLGAGLFAEWRRGPDGAPRADFPLNRREYAGATILLAGRNFGCGSSREHAAWALVDAGFRAVVAPRFADIFYENALKNGLLPVPLAEDEVARLFERVEARPETALTVDLAAQTLRVGGEGGETFRFPIDGFRKTCLRQGVDELGYLLALEPRIAAFERARGDVT
jgi:3-isopropylmalate/(R)-2-methylmalate dehydratase small subunit